MAAIHPFEQNEICLSHSTGFKPGEIQKRLEGIASTEQQLLSVECVGIQSPVAKLDRYYVVLERRLGIPNLNLRVIAYCCTAGTGSSEGKLQALRQVHTA